MQELVPALKVSRINRLKKGSIPHSCFTHEIRASLKWSTPLVQVWAAGLEAVLPGLIAVPLSQGFAENRLSKETQQKNHDIPLLSTLVLLLSACSWNVEAAPAFCLFLGGGRKITWSTKAHSLPGRSPLPSFQESKNSAWMFYESAVCSFQR